MSRYANCTCNECFEIASFSESEPALCWECKEAGCMPSSSSKAERYYDYDLDCTLDRRTEDKGDES